MVDADSLPIQIEDRWRDSVNQVPVLVFNCGKYDLNLVKEYFLRTLSDMSNVKAVKKDNLYMFLTTSRFKFLDVKNHRASGLSYDGWCKANSCETYKLVFPYELLDDYNKLSHIGPEYMRTSTLSLKEDLWLPQWHTPKSPEFSDPEKINGH